jgi:hypothetical protein
MATDQNILLSPLLRLPAELRLQIYAYVLTSPGPLSIYCWRRYVPFGFATRLLRHPRHFLALVRLDPSPPYPYYYRPQLKTPHLSTLTDSQTQLSTTRQIYAETHALPFHLNTFLFKSSDAFIPWCTRFTSQQLCEIRNVKLVTWMGRHMLEGEAWVPKRVEEVFPIDMLGGLRSVVVEVRHNGSAGDCVRGECWNCEGDGKGKGKKVAEEEGRLKGWFKEGRGVSVEFVRVPV